MRTASENSAGSNLRLRRAAPARQALLLLLITVALCLRGAGAASPSLKDLQARPQLRVLVTDSGLGGLSVCGDLERKALARKAFSAVDIIFCNALPEANVGYNNLATPQRKARVFSDALAGMVKRYRPDVILIACNTLSVVYPDTEISRSLKVPVVGIVDLGAEMLAGRLHSLPSSAAVIFGTETTISAGAHKAQCLAKGIAAARVVAQPCPDLAAEIQTNPRGEAARNLIDLYVEEAVSRLPKGTNHLIAALCCTHYGYCAEMFSQAFAAAGRKDVEVLNPNDNLADLLFAADAARRFPAAEVAVSVVSRALLSPDETQAIGALLEKNSPRTAAALRRYEQRADLFPFQRD